MEHELIFDQFMDEKSEQIDKYFRKKASIAESKQLNAAGLNRINRFNKVIKECKETTN